MGRRGGESECRSPVRSNMWCGVTTTGGGQINISSSVYLALATFIFFTSILSVSGIPASVWHTRAQQDETISDLRTHSDGELPAHDRHSRSLGLFRRPSYRLDRPPSRRQSRWKRIPGDVMRRSAATRAATSDCYVTRCVDLFVECSETSTNRLQFVRCSLSHRICAAKCLMLAQEADR